MKTKWEIIKNKTQDHWLELKGDDGSRVWEQGQDWKKDGKPIYPYHAVAKWDGCVFFSDYANGYGYDHEHDERCEVGNGCCEQTIHICDIDDMIAMLQGIKDKAKEHFGDEWPNA